MARTLSVRRTLIRLLVLLVAVATAALAGLNLLNAPEVAPQAASADAPLPSAETTPVPNPDDAADDTAIWIHPTDPSQSVVIGTDKSRTGGVGV